MTDTAAMVKCLVWDLDNTLWRGTLLEGDDVQVDDAVRNVIRTLDSRGILQSIASKNDHDEAWARLEALGISEYFVLPQIGWRPKSASVRDIAQQLEFASRTIAFVDDQPTERAEVAFHLPEVRCYRHDRVPDLPGLPEFRPRSVTTDSRRRRQMYHAKFRRDAARETFAGPDEEFLRSLQLDLQIARATSTDIARVEELTLRTSQMNATGIHYSDTTLRDLATDPSHEVLVASLTDRFGPHGAIGVLLLERHTACWNLKLLATSCRVVSFGIGAAILNWLVDEAARAAVHLVADFRATQRNRMMEIAYRFAGFGDEPCTCVDALAASEGVQRFHLRPQHRALPDMMRVRTPDLAAASITAS